MLSLLGDTPLFQKSFLLFRRGSYILHNSIFSRKPRQTLSVDIPLVTRERSRRRRLYTLHLQFHRKRTKSPGIGPYYRPISGVDYFRPCRQRYRGQSEIQQGTPQWHSGIMDYRNHTGRHAYSGKQRRQHVLDSAPRKRS